MESLMIWFHILVVLLFIILGARLGGVGIGLMGAAGVLLLVATGVSATAEEVPWAVIGIIMSVICTELIERFELDPTRRWRSYSKGNRQKVALIAALSCDVELLLLDEPTSGLDPLMESVFQQVVAERALDGISVLLSSHILSEVEALCQRVTATATHVVGPDYHGKAGELLSGLRVLPRIQRSQHAHCR